MFVLGHVKSVFGRWNGESQMGGSLPVGSSARRGVLEHADGGSPDVPPQSRERRDRGGDRPAYDRFHRPQHPSRERKRPPAWNPSLTGPQYRLGPEDQIRVSVWENPQLTLDLVVRPDGKISMPLIQDVMAEGQTAAELAITIQQRLLDFIKEPQVSVIVLQVNAPKFYVMGNVVRPGTYPLRGETSVLQALSLAGGFTQFASPRNIKLIRNTAGKQEVRKVNYNNMIDEGGEGNYLLRSGDTIVVP